MSSDTKQTDSVKADSAKADADTEVAQITKHVTFATKVDEKAATLLQMPRIPRLKLPRIESWTRSAAFSRGYVQPTTFGRNRRANVNYVNSHNSSQFFSELLNGRRVDIMILDDVKSSQSQSQSSRVYVPSLAEIGERYQGAPLNTSRVTFPPLPPSQSAREKHTFRRRNLYQFK
jgi:hypothetical protein